MATLGNAPHTPYPGTVSGIIEEAIAQVDALEEQLLARARTQSDPLYGAFVLHGHPWALYEALRDGEGHPLDTEP